MAEHCGGLDGCKYLIIEGRISFCSMHKAAPAMLDALEAIRDYEPNEVAIDEFSYNRMVENYRDAARKGIAATQGSETP